MSNNTLDTLDPVREFSPLGLSVGLTLLLLLVVIVVGLVTYKFKSQIRNMVQSRRRGGRDNQKKMDYLETPQDDSQHYIGLIREQPAAHNPIYENLSTQTHGYQRPAAHHGRLPGEPEEDLYLQCDSPDNAIYSNDPKCSLVICDTSNEEDVYIIPDS